MDWIISRENSKMFDAAYALGAYMGDGFQGYNYRPDRGSWYTVGVSCMDKEIVERWQQQVHLVFGRKYAITEYSLKTGTRMFTCRASAKEVYEFFVFNTVWKTQIPNDFINAPREVQREFIAGLFDTDGSVAETGEAAGKVRYQLKFGSVEKRVVEDVAALLQRNGVLVGKIGVYVKAGYREHYTIQPGIRSFLDAGFYFRCLRKEERLRRYLGIASETVYADAATSA